MAVHYSIYKSHLQSHQFMSKSINNGRIWNNGTFGVDSKQMEAENRKQDIYLAWLIATSLYILVYICSD